VSTTDNGPDVVLATLTAYEFTIWLDGYHWRGVHEAQRAEAAAAADFAQMARRLRETAGAPSHQELTAWRRRHQVDAATTASYTHEWPQEVA